MSVLLMAAVPDMRIRRASGTELPERKNPRSVFMASSG
jgi:hypothetical protein